MDDEAVRRATFARQYEMSRVPDYEPYSPTVDVFKALLHFGVPLEKAKFVSECGEKFVPVQCSVSPHFDKLVAPVYCRNIRLCGRDDNIERYGGADDMLWKLRNLFACAGAPLYTWAVDFTESADIWPRIRQRELSVLGGLAYQTMKEYFTKLWPMPVKFGMNVYVQAWHSEEPGKGWYPHVHSIIPRLFFRDDNTLVRSDMKWLDHEKVKLIWRRNVEEYWGKSSGGFRHRQDMFSVKVQVRYEDDVASKMGRRGVKHRLRYMGRGFAIDFTKYVNRGYRYDHWDEKYVGQMLMGNGHKRCQSYGILAAKNLSDESPFSKWWGLKLWTKRERMKARRWRPCPVHPEGHMVLDFASEVEFTRKEAFDAGFVQMKPNFRAGVT